MPVAKPNPTARAQWLYRSAKGLIALYRREEERWGPREMLESLFEFSPNMLAGTAASCFTRLLRPRCSFAAVRKMADEAIREMVGRGHAAEVKSFIDSQAARRAMCGSVEKARALRQLRLGLDRLADAGDLEALEMVAGLIDRLAAHAEAAA